MAVERKLTDKQRRFVEEYVIDMNGAQAAIRAGYSAKAARQIATVMMSKDYMKAAIQERMDEVNKRCIMQADEIMEILSRLARGEDDEDQIVVEKIGDGRSRAKNMSKKMSKSDQIKALSILAKRFGLDQPTNDKATVIQIIDDIEDDEYGED